MLEASEVVNEQIVYFRFFSFIHWTTSIRVLLVLEFFVSEKILHAVLLFSEMRERI